MDDSLLSQISPGNSVIDMDGLPVGEVRAVYPHYVAVERDGLDPLAYQVPPHAVAAIEGDTVRLSVGRDALDQMTPEAEAALDLPRHGEEQ